MIYVFVTRIQCHGLCICNNVMVYVFNVMVYVFVTRIQCHVFVTRIMYLCICNKDSMSWFMYL